MKVIEMPSLIPMILVVQKKITVLIAFQKIEVLFLFFFPRSEITTFLSLCFKTIHYFENNKENTVGEISYFS